MRNRASLVLPGAASLVVGIVLLAIPAILVLTGSVLNLVWTVLLWVGFAEVVIGAVLLALAAAARPAATATGADPDARYDVADGEPAETAG